MYSLDSTLVRWMAYGKSSHSKIIIYHWLVTNPSNQAWSTLLTPLLSREVAYGKRMDLARYPTAVNTFFLVVPILLVVTLFPLSIAITQLHNTSFDLYRQLDVMVEVAANNFDIGVMTDPVPIKQMTGQLLSYLPRIVIVWRRVWIAWTVFVFFLFFVRKIFFNHRTTKFGLIYLGTDLLLCFDHSIERSQSSHR